MPDYGPCTDSSCQDTSVRLFDCVHHCMKRVCLKHLIEHDRLIETNRKQLELVQNELKRLYLVYSSLIDENKIRSEYEKKLDDYKRLIQEMNSILESNRIDIESIRLFNEKLKKIIAEKQKQTNENLTIVKVEPMDENSTSSSDEQKDETLFIGFDRLQNMIIDTDYHRRKAMEPSTSKNKIENKTFTTSTDTEHTTDEPYHRVAGICPLWVNGSYGLQQNQHLYRLCRKTHFSDLSNHMRQYHGLLASIANAISRAVHWNIPTSKTLFPADLQITDPRRSFICPLRSNCHVDYYFATMALRAHLSDAHSMNPLTAESKVRKLRRLNKNKPISKLESQVCRVIQQIETTYQKT